MWHQLWILALIWPLGPWSALLLLGLLLTLLRDQPYLGPLLPFALLSLQFTTRSVGLIRWAEVPAFHSALKAGADPYRLAEVYLKHYQGFNVGSIAPAGVSAYVRGRLEAPAHSAGPSAGPDLHRVAASVALKQPVASLPVR